MMTGGWLVLQKVAEVLDITIFVHFITCCLNLIPGFACFYADKVLINIPRDEHLITKGKRLFFANITSK
jgi:hypothetical protein